VKCWSVEINGLSFCMFTRLMILKILSVGSLGATCLYQWVIFIFHQVTVLNWILPGLQAHVHISELSWLGTESHTIWKCLLPWHEFCHYCFYSLYCNTGLLSITFCMQIILTVTEGPICSNLILNVLKDWHSHWLRDILPQSLWSPRRNQQIKGSQWTASMVESV